MVVVGCIVSGGPDIPGRVQGRHCADLLVTDRNSGTSTTSYFVSSDYSGTGHSTWHPLDFPLSTISAFHEPAHFTGISGPSPCLCILCQRPIGHSLLSKHFLCFGLFFFLLISRNETMGHLSTNIKTLLPAWLVTTHFCHAASYISGSSR